MLKLKVPRVDVSLKFIAVFLTLYLSATPIAGFFYVRWSIIAFIVFAIAFFLTGRFLAKRKSMLFYIMASALFLLTCILTKDNDLGHYVGRIMNLTTAFFFCQIITKDDFEYCFGKIMCWLSAFSLIIYVFFNIFPSAVWSLPKSLAGHDKDELYIIISVQGEYVNLSDGRKHPLSKQKRKNRKHLQLTSEYDETLRKKLTEGGTVSDGEISSFIRTHKQ